MKSSEFKYSEFREEIYEQELQQTTTTQQSQYNQDINPITMRTDVDSTNKQITSNIKILRIFNCVTVYIGPDHKQFCLGFCMILVMVTLINYLSFSLKQPQNQSQQTTFYNYWKYSGLLLTSLPCLFYLLTAITDPGIYKPSLSQPLPNQKYCYVCKISTPDKVFHCFQCSTCYLELDHHCGWMSKCVARNNLKYFYGMMGSMVIMMLYFWTTVAFMIINRT